MHKQNFTLLLLAACSFMPQTFSAAHFFKRLGLHAYKAKSILTGLTLVGGSLYFQKFIYNGLEKQNKEIDFFCEATDKQEQENFRETLKSLIPLSEFNRPIRPQPLQKFFCFTEGWFMDSGFPIPVTEPYCEKNNSKNIIVIPSSFSEKYNDISFIIRHETAHILLGHIEQSTKEMGKQSSMLTASAALLTAYRAKGIFSHSAKVVFTKNIRSLGLFTTYGLYNLYKFNQLKRKGEREADDFALKYTDSIYQLNNAIAAFKDMPLSNSPHWIYDEFFITHPKTEERIAKIQEKIDLLKAQEAAADLEKEKQTNKS